MNIFEHNLLIKIEKKIDDLNTRSEHRITALENIAEKQQDQIDNCLGSYVVKENFDTVIGSIRKAIGFLYAIVLASISAALYKAFG